MYDGLAMFPFCQIMIRDLPWVPEPLKAYEAITVFLISYLVEGEVHCGLPRYCEGDAHQYEIRAYKNLKDTIIVDRSGDFETAPKCLNFEQIDDDAPAFDQIPIPPGTDVQSLQKTLRREYRTFRGFKLGGYPQLWQDPFEGIDNYVIQLGPVDLDCIWGDDGNAYILLDDDGNFALTWQSS